MLPALLILSGWQQAAGNLPPTVSITSPANGATFTAPANLTITANAGDSGGAISKVDFYQGTALLGTDTTAPYSFDWSNVPAGIYSLTAKATDNGGATATRPQFSSELGVPLFLELEAISGRRLLEAISCRGGKVLVQVTEARIDPGVHTSVNPGI